MTARRLAFVALAAALSCLMFSGCGGEAGPIVRMHGLYIGDMEGCDEGPLRFFVDRNGRLNGNFRLDALCPGAVQIRGTVDPDGNVTFQGTACGITFQGEGKIERSAPGSNVFVGSGTWSAGAGCTGTWQVRRHGATGSISV